MPLWLFNHITKQLLFYSNLTFDRLFLKKKALKEKIAAYLLMFKKVFVRTLNYKSTRHGLAKKIQEELEEVALQLSNLILLLVMFKWFSSVFTVLRTVISLSWNTSFPDAVCLTFRNSRPGVFLRKGVMKICSKFTGEHPSRSVI